MAKESIQTCFSTFGNMVTMFVCNYRCFFSSLPSSLILCPFRPFVATCPFNKTIDFHLLFCFLATQTTKKYAIRFRYCTIAKSSQQIKPLKRSRPPEKQQAIKLNKKARASALARAHAYTSGQSVRKVDPNEAGLVGKRRISVCSLSFFKKTKTTSEKRV